MLYAKPHRLLCALLAIAALFVQACSPSAQTPCKFQEDCATPREYCDSQTSVCMVYECIEDADCRSVERCNPLVNTCELTPVPDLGPPEDMRGGDMGDTPRDLGGVDGGMFDMMDVRDDGTLDMRDVEEMTPPSDLGDRVAPVVLSIDPVAGSSVGEGGVDPQWTITFSEPIDRVSVDPFSVFLEDDAGEQIPINVEVSEDATQATLTLVDPTTFDVDAGPFRVSVSDYARDLSMNRLEEEFRARYFGPFERDETLHALAMKWAPEVYQEIREAGSREWLHDMPTRVDFDGDYDASSNFLNLATIAQGDVLATAYYHIAQTPSHDFITYVFYYPSRVLPSERDPQRLDYIEHDFTGALFVIERVTDELLLVEGVRIEDGTDLLIAFTNDSRPEVSLPGEGRIWGTFTSGDQASGWRYPFYVPAARHEACSWEEGEVKPPFDVCVHPARDFREGTAGALLRPAEVGMSYVDATPPVLDEGERFLQMTYALRPLEEIFWFRREHVGASNLFTRQRTYTPEGNRPTEDALNQPLLLPQALSHRAMQEDNGFTPYTWLTQPGRTNRGQWLIDPAWTIPRRYYLPDEPAWRDTYCAHSTLGIDARMSDPDCLVSTP